MNQTHKHSLHTLRDVIIFFFSITGIAHVYRALLGRKGPLVRVVVFHDVPDAVWFESMIRTLTANYCIVSPDNFRAGHFHDGCTNVLVTFDDGYDTWLSIAAPLLKKYRVQALFFINSGLLDVATDDGATNAYMRSQLSVSPKKPLTWEGLAKLAGEGHAIGGHTRMHENLSELDDHMLDAEIAYDKDQLEAHLGKPITDFAYPFGTVVHISESGIDAAKRAGYARAYTAISRFVPAGETFRIPRMCIETGLSPRSLKRWVDGAYDLLDMLKDLCVR